MALAAQKQKHTNTSTKSSTWYTQHGNRDPAWRSTFLITLTRPELSTCSACAFLRNSSHMGFGDRLCLILLCRDHVFWWSRGHVYCLILFCVALLAFGILWLPTWPISHSKLIKMQHIFHFHFSSLNILAKAKDMHCIVPIIFLDKINQYCQTRTKQNVSFSYKEKSWRIWILKTPTLSWWDFL